MGLFCTHIWVPTKVAPKWPPPSVQTCSQYNNLKCALLAQPFVRVTQSDSASYTIDTENVIEKVIMYLFV